AAPPAPVPAAAPAPAAASGELPVRVRINRIQEKDVESLVNEMALMGQILHRDQSGGDLSLWLQTTTPAADLEAVCCFIVNADQVSVTHEAVPGAAPAASAPAPAAEASAVPEPVLAVEAPAPVQDAPEPASARETVAETAGKPGGSPKTAKPKESGTIRVGVEKVDQIINLVGELVITQAMLLQTSQTLDPVLHDRLLNGIEQLDRNARDLQEAVMSIRMMPMDYVFSRFPRVVRENATKLGKRIRLVTKGQATELDKSLIERIIDPLTHLVRNSLDHGLETPDARIAQGKDPEGTLILSAQHNGGQIIIDVIDDGAGLNRERILKKAIASGFPVSEATPDDELWQLIFAPGFSTADKVTDISGRGVGMDVVRRNIQAMGGHVQLSSRKGEGTTTRIVLPLTLAILDGMSVKVGEETFILPLSHVTESMQATEDQIHRISETEQVLHVRGEYLPIVALHEVFNVGQAETDLTRAIAVILQAEDQRFALMVDHLLGQHQVVVKNLETNYRKVPGISAATILGDGSVALIVDVFALRRTSSLRAGAAA
ncbi:MAG: chemotaxis protein CheW, partial [Castellaniella sp.]|uniref:chemotaxis protein CheW n=1 Tax=Castellaniella sp. TaxID=1955812 RepID=UPI003C74EE9A